MLPGLSVSLRADALSMVFAVSASFLWVITVFYSAGYMRGLEEHEQTRFNTCFALALFGAIGCAFADNLLTLYLFYEIVSICTYPLVAHHQDEEGYESGKKYLTYLTTTAKGLILPAMVLIYVLTGTLDFANNINTGILPAGRQPLGRHGLYACCILGFAKNGVIEGGLVHIANHAFSKITLFFCAGAIYVATHKKNISEMSGLGRVMPFTFGAFALASLSMIGAPPVAGFVTKWYLLNGAFDAGSVGIIIVLLVSTLLNAAYFAPVVYHGFFGKTFRGRCRAQIQRGAPGDGGSAGHHRGISVVIGLYPGFFMSFVHAVLS